MDNTTVFEIIVTDEQLSSLPQEFALQYLMKGGRPDQTLDGRTSYNFNSIGIESITSEIIDMVVAVGAEVIDSGQLMWCNIDPAMLDQNVPESFDQAVIYDTQVEGEILVVHERTWREYCITMLSDDGTSAIINLRPLKWDIDRNKYTNAIHRIIPHDVFVALYNSFGVIIPPKQKSEWIKNNVILDI